MTILVSDGDELPNDVWAVIPPSIRMFMYRDGNPYGLGNAIEYDWGDARVDLDITIKIWRNSAGIHAKWIRS